MAFTSSCTGLPVAAVTFRASAVDEGLRDLGSAHIISLGDEAPPRVIIVRRDFACAPAGVS